MYIFDEHNEQFRSPGGAIEAGGMLQLQIHLRRGGGFGASALCRRDGTEGRAMPMRFSHALGAYDVYTCRLRFPTAGLFWYHFRIHTKDGTHTIGPNGHDGEYQVTVYAPAEQSADWIQGGVIYHIFVDRFRRGGTPQLRPGAILREDWGGCPEYLPDEAGIVQNADFFGGDFYGIIEKLPYLKSIGVSCLYLSPIFEAASNHKYDTGDFLRIDTGFGGDEGFAKLCSAAESYGMKIILDGVFNHVGADSRYFNKYGHYPDTGAYQSQDSPYSDWFLFSNWNNEYAAWWGIDLLPTLNKQSASYRDFICGEDGVVAHWTCRGVAGWRLDVVDELPDGFLDPLCAAMRRENPEALIIGEVWEDASNKIAYDVRRRYFQGGQLNGVTNYPLKNAIIAFVKDGDAPMLASTLAEICQNYPEPVLHSLMNVLGTHDTMRILTVLGGENLPITKAEMENYRLNEAQLAVAKQKLRLAATLQYTLPGVPCLYYGDEAGMEGGADPFCRRCYPWGEEDISLIAWYASLARLRREQPVLKDGKYSLICAGGGVFAFTRGSGAEQIFVAVNNSEQEVSFAMDAFNYDLLQNKAVDGLVVPAGQVGIFTIRAASRPRQKVAKVLRRRTM